LGVIVEKRDIIRHGKRAEEDSGSRRWATGREGVGLVRTAVLSFLAGMSLSNALPHFVKGVTNDSYPCVLGRTAVPNFVAGWLGLVLTAVLIDAARVSRHPKAAWMSGAVGALVLGYFHAAGNADRSTTAMVSLVKRK
jgi:hypothetical protein